MTEEQPKKTEGAGDRAGGYSARRFVRKDSNARGPRSAVNRSANRNAYRNGTRPQGAAQQPQGGAVATGSAQPRREGGNAGGAFRGNRGGASHGGHSHSTPRTSTRMKHSTGREKADARRMMAPYPKDQDNVVIPPLKDGDVRIIALGGVEEIGRNMTMIEYKDSIVVIDAGLQFKEENTPGVDYILANTKYLEDRKHKVKAVMITHGHLDHTGGIPYLMGKIGNPPLYTRALTGLMIQKRQEEFSHLPALDMRIIEKNDRITVGDFKAKFFAVTHTIPDAMGIILETPYGNIIHTGDLKLDHVDGVPTMEEEDEFDNIVKSAPTLLLMADSTNVERPGYSFPERTVLANIEEIIRTTEGRIIVATFASLLERLVKIIDVAEILGKKIVLDGRSMKNNVDIARQSGLLKAKLETFIPIEDMEKYPPDRVILLVTGAQGDEFASLMRAANKAHKYLKINKRDTILLSSSVVPGNERSVQKLKDNLSRQGAHLIHYENAKVHSSGHAHHDESLWIHNRLKSRFFMPVHGYHYMLRCHADIAREAGLPDENIIIPDNGMIIEIQDGGKKIVSLKEMAPKGLILVDGFSVGDMQEVVLRDRQMLSQDGIFVVITTLDVATGKVTKSPDVISRGFVYLRESQDLLRQARFLTKKTVEDMVGGSKQIDFDYVKDHVTDAVARLLFQETAKRPIVIPVILTV
ncbi:MAG: ribonuclease J [Candidatus Pacebacteria bacterium]|jgi:ribonuclease J|nr:ribonuclease J [Candidatus Paceibacterota bacterium]